MTLECMDQAILLYAETSRGERHLDGALADEFRRFLHSDPRVFERSHVPGHFTGSAWLVSADGQRVLLMHHRKLGRWLQLGGHADGDAQLAQVALREAGEESGLGGLQVDPAIFDLDRHLIPARPGEPAHWHYDVRYVVRAGKDEAFVGNGESLALAWRSIAALAADPDSDTSLRRMSQRWLQRERIA
jgi:8-oxo-dGTP pyrophosphatase MutT (NUDIX family)